MTTPNCCCNWGAAIGSRHGIPSHEYPEFDCADCEVHQQGLGPTDYRCKRHAREQELADNYRDKINRPIVLTRGDQEILKALLDKS